MAITGLTSLNMAGFGKKTFFGTFDSLNFLSQKTLSRFQVQLDGLHLFHSLLLVRTNMNSALV